MTAPDHDLLRHLCAEQHLQAALVIDTSVLLKNPELATWDLDFTAVLVLSDLVLAELDTHKQRSDARESEAEAARTVLRSLAHANSKESLAELRTLRGGIRINDGLWCVSAAVNRDKFPAGLDVKRADDQIASIAWVLKQELSPMPVLLLTADNGQCVKASSVGINHFLEEHPFVDPGREALTAHVEALSSTPSAVSDPLEGYLPPRESIVPMFIGRDNELRQLNDWLLDEGKQKWALVGDGGKGKSAIAYQFADRVKRLNPGRAVDAVIWMSAKKHRFVEGSVQELVPDFSRLEEALDFILSVFNQDSDGEDLVAKKRRVIALLNESPSLLVVDDIDSVATEDGEARGFFTDDILKTRSKVLFTSRRPLFGMEARQTIVRGLDGEDAERFVSSKAKEYGLEPSRFAASLGRLLSVTEGSPLYIEDLLRLCHVLPVGDAIRRWDQDKGERARAYALQREIEELSKQDELARPVLMACAVANGPVSAAELSNVLGKPRDEIEETLNHLRQFYLVPTPTQAEDVVLFDLNYNTRNLVLAEYGASEDLRQIKGAFTSLGRLEGGRSDESKISAVCSQARLLAPQGRFVDAEKLLFELNDQYPNRGLVQQQLGWLYKRWQPSPRVTDAREAFRRAEELNVKRNDLYWHWADLEESQGQFRAAIEIAERGQERLGVSQSLALREAGARLLQASVYARNQDRYSSIEELNKSLTAAKRGLEAPPLFFESSDVRSRLFAVAVRAASRLNKHDEVAKLFSNWKREAPDDEQLLQMQRTHTAGQGVSRSRS